MNAVGKTLASVPSVDVKLDQQIKKVLACKPILSRILAEVVEECKGMTFDEVEKCIEGDVVIGKEYMEPGFSNLIGTAQEDFEVGEGLIRYDIRTYLNIPNCPEPQLAKILIDVEAQKSESPGYDIPTRGLYYCCRMISSQLTQEFTVATNDSVKYNNIKKVYSIWICTETSQKRANCIEKYSIKKEMLSGMNADSPRYDLMSAIVINLSKYHNYGNTDSELIRFLTDLFNDEMPVTEKLQILENTYNLSVTEEIKKEVADMCSYTVAVEQKGIEKGIEKGIKKGEDKLARLIRLLMNTGRTDDVMKVTANEDIRAAFYKEFGIDD